jgi:hypothetical protein
MVKASIRNIFLGSLFASLTLTVSVATAAEPPQTALVTVDQAPGAELPPQIAAEVRAAIEDALAGRAPAGVPIDVTLEATSVVVRVGSLSRRIAIAQWDYPAERTVALHVLDLLQPAPEVPEVAPAGQAGAPAATVVAEARASERATEPATESTGAVSVHVSVAGARGAQLPDPWMASFAIGAGWTHHDWLRIGVEFGWDHAIVRHKEDVTINYDATPLRLILAAQSPTVMVGVRAGIAPYRVTGEQAYRVVSPVVGPFVGARVPIVGRFRGLLVAGFDYFARRTELSGLDPTTYSTPAVAFYAGLVAEAVLRP